MQTTWFDMKRVLTLIVFMSSLLRTLAQVKCCDRDQPHWFMGLAGKCTWNPTSFGLSLWTLSLYFYFCSITAPLSCERAPKPKITAFIMGKTAPSALEERSHCWFSSAHLRGALTLQWVSCTYLILHVACSIASGLNSMCIHVAVHCIHTIICLTNIQNSLMVFSLLFSLFTMHTGFSCFITGKSTFLHWKFLFEVRMYTSSTNNTIIIF